jgi:hypothetical protein
MIHYEIMMEQRDNNSEKSIQGWKQLLGSVEEKKNFWKGDFWLDYWEIQIDLKKAEELEQKDQTDFESMMKELDFSDLPSLEVLEDSFNQAIDSAEHLAHLWKDIVHRHQLALRNDSCLKEFSDEIVEAKNSLDYWNIEGLFRRALGHEKVAQLLSCEATHRDSLEEKFHLNWMKARDAIYDTQASYRFVKGVISKIINELSAHVSHQDNDQMLHDWLEEVEYEIVFWESEISWSEGEEAHLIAAYATENCYFHEDWSSNSSDDDSDVMHEEPDYLSQSRLYNIKKAIYLLSRARDVQSNAISKLPPKFHENFQYKYNLASDKINHWNRFIYDATTSKDF